VFSPHGHCNGTISFYYGNATSLAKSNAVQQLHTDIIEHDVDVALVAESWFTVIKILKLINIG